MTLFAHYPNVFAQAYGTHECFRRCGFPAEEIFVHLNPSPDHSVLVILRMQGKEFLVTVGKFYDGVDDFAARWTAFCKDVHSGKIPESELQEAYQVSVCCQQKVEFLRTMERKGIASPLLEIAPEAGLVPPGLSRFEREAG